jgi:hypothetical protein
LEEKAHGKLVAGNPLTENQSCGSKLPNTRGSANAILQATFFGESNMKPVSSTLTFPDDIVNLHDALRALMPPRSNCFKPAGDYPTIPDLEKLARNVGLEGEHYGMQTERAIKFFQHQEGLEPNRLGQLDDQTAAKLNEYLDASGAFDSPDNLGDRT